MNQVSFTKGNLIFYVGNYYAARSTDGGQTWEFLDPYYDFENIHKPQIHRFCCDQRVIYDERNDIFIWYRRRFLKIFIELLILPTNKITIGISNDTYPWHMYDIYPTEILKIILKNIIIRFS